MSKRDLTTKLTEKVGGKRSAYKRAKRKALASLKKGVGGTFEPVPRASLHDRESLR